VSDGLVFGQCRRAPRQLRLLVRTAGRLLGFVAAFRQDFVGVPFTDAAHVAARPASHATQKPVVRQGKKFLLQSALLFPCCVLNVPLPEKSWGTILGLGLMFFLCHSTSCCCPPSSTIFIPLAFPPRPRRAPEIHPLESRY